MANFLLITTLLAHLPSVTSRGQGFTDAFNSTACCQADYDQCTAVNGYWGCVWKNVNGIPFGNDIYCVSQFDNYACASACIKETGVHNFLYYRTEEFKNPGHHRCACATGFDANKDYMVGPPYCPNGPH